MLQERQRGDEREERCTGDGVLASDAARPSLSCFVLFLLPSIRADLVKQILWQRQCASSATTPLRSLQTPIHPLQRSTRWHASLLHCCGCSLGSGHRRRRGHVGGARARRRSRGRVASGAVRQRQGQLQDLCESFKESLSHPFRPSSPVPVLTEASDRPAPVRATECYRRAAPACPTASLPGQQADVESDRLPLDRVLDGLVRSPDEEPSGRGPADLRGLDCAGLPGSQAHQVHRQLREQFERLRTRAGSTELAD